MAEKASVGYIYEAEYEIIRVILTSRFILKSMCRI